MGSHAMTIKYTLNQMKDLSNETPFDVVQKFGFEETIRLATSMLMDESWDEELQGFATSLLRELMNKYPDKWNSSWRFDALLGFANNIIMDYDARYEAYKRAMEKTSSPPAELLIALARCYNSPGIPPVTEAEAINLIKKAIKNKLYPEGVRLLKGLYRITGDKQEENYWNKILTAIEDTGPELPRLDKIPNINC